MRSRHPRPTRATACLLTAACVALAVMLAAALPAAAQDKEVRTIPFEGPEFFAHILFNEGLTPVHSVEDALLDGGDTVFIVFGDTFHFSPMPGNPRRLARFHEAGCSILIATDYGLTIPEFAVNILGDRIIQPDEAQAFQGSRRCPWLSFQSANDPDEQTSRDHPIFHFLRQGLATNCPSYVIVQPTVAGLTPLLDFPANVRAPGSGMGRIPGMPPGKLPGVRPPRHYIVGSPKDAPPDRRVLIIAGHGIFTNGMMLQDQTDNFDFAVNVVRWLREGPDGQKRKRALFMVDRKIITNFDMKLTPRPPPIPIPTVQMLNRLIRGLEDERFFHRAFVGLLGRQAGRFVAIVVGIASLLLLLYGAKKLTRARSHHDATAPSMVGAPAPANPTVPIKERSQAKLRKGNYADESRALALEWLRAELGVTPDRGLDAVSAAFEARGFFWSRWQLLRWANYVLELARAAAPLPVSRREFFALVEALRHLSAALDDGRLALLVDGKNVRQG